MFVCVLHIADDVARTVARAAPPSCPRTFAPFFLFFAPPAPPPFNGAFLSAAFLVAISFCVLPLVAVLTLSSNELPVCRFRLTRGGVSLFTEVDVFGGLSWPHISALVALASRFILVVPAPTPSCPPD